MSHSLTPSRLTLARHRRGLTLVALSKLLNNEIKPRTLSSYENGTTAPSSDNLAALARVLRFPIEFLTAGEIPQASVDGVSFRALTKMTASQRDMSISTATLAAALGAWMADEFTLPPEDVPEIDPATADRIGRDDWLGRSVPAAAAAQVRSSWDLGEQPITNMVHLVEAHGVRVFAIAPECKDVDAFSFWMEGVPYICLDPTRTSERMRFDVAHELGHLVMHRQGAPTGRQAELEANRFASSLLMPEPDVRASAPSYPTFDALVDAKKRWNVSVAALNFRLHQLGIISEWHYRELCIEIAKFGRHQEPESSPREQSYVLTKVFAALRSEGLRRQDIARMSHLHLRDLDALVGGLTVSGIDGDDEPPPPSTNHHDSDGGHPRLSLVR